jgi:hypothetical protein
MKKINWTEIAIAAPTALVFANLGGMAAMLTVSALIAICIAAAKLTTTKRVLVPVAVKGK